jgi:hypothetical protein
MAYRYYSEVYFAIDFDDNKRIKIGETTNARRRDRQLDVWITKVVEVGGDKCYRLLIESLLREKISRMPRVQQIGNDYFYCESKEIALSIQNQFTDWVDCFQKNIEKLLTND